MDWTEQHHHLAGALGAALLQHLLDAGWIGRAAESRVIHLLPDGVAGPHDWLSADVTAELETAPHPQTPEPASG